MLWRRTAREMEAGKGDGNRQAMKDVFDMGDVLGLVAMNGDDATTWSSICICERAFGADFKLRTALRPHFGRSNWPVLLSHADIWSERSQSL